MRLFPSQLLDPQDRAIWHESKAWRPAIGGLALGFAAILGYSAWAGAPALAWLPFTFMAIPFLVVNALVCLFIARAMLRTVKP